MNKTIKTIILAIAVCTAAAAQSAGSISLPEAGAKTLLNEGWLARRANEIKADGNTLSAQPFNSSGWMKATVPGTVLTTLLNNGIFPPPEVSLNNNLIPDIHETGADFYTFWFVRQFRLDTPLPEGRKLWLNFRGINYRAEIFLNGKRLNPTTHEGMFLRKSYEITPWLKDSNTLAVIVYPPNPYGNPNGGQGGDGRIARNVTMQFTPGWDWIQPVRDRNTGIWDEVSLTVTGDVRVQHPYVSTRVPGIRQTSGKQKEAYLNISAELENTAAAPRSGSLICETNGTRIALPVTLAAGEKRSLSVREIAIANPRLWWPNGIAGDLGKQPLYDLRIWFEAGGRISDSQSLRYGIREISGDKCPVTGGRRFFVNGQPIYITGGNYIASDWLLRLSPERYRAEVRFHAEMNMRMIRIWGGALLERPEFYDACDEYGILVFQDLWGSGDCNGAWNDQTKADSRERRWEYPDNHDLFLASVEDQVKMIRNHPSLALWCGANEWPLAADIDARLRTELFPRLDPGRLFASYSTDTIFTRNTIGGVGDGPYGIQEPEWFFSFRSTPFNPEAGSVGSPEIESMREMMTPDELAQFPRQGRSRSAAWAYHKDLGYGNHLERYGPVDNIETYCRYAQAVNYDQYRSFMEGWASHLWDWYTGILVWKTQNPWTSLRGQMYDWHLDVNASLYGARQGCEPLHAQYNPVSRKAELVNTGLDSHSLTVTAEIFARDGRRLWNKTQEAVAEPNRVAQLFDIPIPQGVEGVYFLKLALKQPDGEISSHIYWPSTREKDFSSLADLPRTHPAISLHLGKEGSSYRGRLSLEAGSAISFFNRIKVWDKTTGRRILPVHYSDNYVTLMPGDKRSVDIEFASELPPSAIEVSVESWTGDRQIATP
ncbi:MAG: beta-glycosidase [Tannerellaceae bacterium]|jgi:hypothetical protein|nr:beta-glycosidase [Tannerellaceae bacterium]